MKLQRWGVPLAQIHEMDWWDQLNIKGVAIHCTPARHYSGRKSMDNSTLWASWMLKGPTHSAYFSGDTWLDIHMHPEAAIQAHKDLGATTMLPVHWATFSLAYHAWAEPMQPHLTSRCEFLS